MDELKKVRKWYWVWEFEKEEQWLNGMAQSGWKLERIGFAVYYFTKCDPGEYTIRLEMRNNDEEYITFMRELGAEYVGRMAKWIYFRRPSSLGEFDIFSDIDSKLEHLEKIRKMLWGVGIANLVIGICNSLSPIHIGWINLLCATLLMYSLGRIEGKKEALEKERQLHE